ncbi:integrase [Defluviimonas sp. WL0002]|uniref:Integrase n=1 Tax=Albidovulum marisflavi TaxID=2984159 RepID=A0ABT2ZGH9_9RHOB|nr:integrase [Defluviimonas sp. WL0002]MCV2870248.1 integrase [Defluviimonas sp. WL0002]
MTIANPPAICARRPGLVRGRVAGQKQPLLPKHVWAHRVRQEIFGNHGDLAHFNLAIDSKLRGCDLAKLEVVDANASVRVNEGARIIQNKTKRSVRFDITESIMRWLARWMEEPLMIGSEHRWPGRFHERLHISTRQTD